MPVCRYGGSVTTARTNHYSDLSAGYLRKAHLHFDEGDFGQASEKGWGAAATALKAVAEEPWLGPSPSLAVATQSARSHE